MLLQKAHKASKMASMKLKTAYVLALISFFIWLSILLSVFFPAGTLANPVSFPNSSLLMLFCGSAIIASVSCIIIGVDYLGLNFKLKQRPKNITQAPRLPKNIPISQSANNADAKEAQLQDSTQQEDTISILVPPQLEEEQENE
jgi:flagellar biogenesis protein FliO